MEGTAGDSAALSHHVEAIASANLSSSLWVLEPVRSSLFLAIYTLAGFDCFEEVFQHQTMH